MDQFLPYQIYVDDINQDVVLSTKISLYEFCGEMGSEQRIILCENGKSELMYEEFRLDYERVGSLATIRYFPGNLVWEYISAGGQDQTYGQVYDLIQFLKREYL